MAEMILHVCLYPGCEEEEEGGLRAPYPPGAEYNDNGGDGGVS